MFTNTSAVERPTTEKFIDRIIDREKCKTHDADIGFVCWGVTTSAGLGLGAVCNQRARKAGFNHKISEASIRLKKHKK